MEEFKDFKAFMEAIDDYGKQSGIVKVIPPQEWKDTLPDLSASLEHVRVRNPIIQHIIGSQGVYTQTNVEKRRPYTLEQWLGLCEHEDHRPPEIGTDRTFNVARSRQRATVKKGTVLSDGSPPPSASTMHLQTRSKSKPASTHLNSPPPSPLFHQQQQQKTKREIQAEEIALAASDAAIPLTFNPYCTTNDRYTVDYCKQLERIYWRNLTFNPPMYGADMAGTLFDSSVNAWNVSKLDNILNQLGVVLPGVNAPYLYFGMWKATFPWHVEDMDLYSINYLHFGAPKQWYAIPTHYSKKFENVMQSTHKTFIASPKLLANSGVPVHRCVQQEGEFIITFPYGYHSGYNLGFNCAESVNFALNSWVEIGKRAKACTCISDSVMIDVSVFDGGLKRKRKDKDDSEEEEGRRKKCVLCPHHHEPELITEQGEGVHRLCAEAVPDTSVQHGIVHGVDSIVPARWKLLCLYCQKREGACTQCCDRKCCRAFHATCAEKAGATIMQKQNTDGAPHVDIYCSVHDPQQRQKRLEEKQALIQSTCQEMRTGRYVYAHWQGSGYYPGAIEACYAEKKTCCVRFEDGSTRMVPWRNIRFSP
ncbi:hypothetical protein EC973_008838 [Apophysomyces ossiformis]|uniref:[histone H3]-trimethyl-L-lysine(9) demethylase n=1 Tax=Apophysomyces ossiformis TaxID=679940 RepID=A0A8H7EU97_9FUNG|nr:hypothetical protein EC973_008838 [Apophysomyces ossiformis]